MSDDAGFSVQVSVEDLREKVEALTAKVDRLAGIVEALVAELGARAEPDDDG